MDKWIVGKQFENEINEIFKPQRLKDHLTFCIKRYFDLKDNDPLPKEITLPECTLSEKEKTFQFDLDHDEIHVIGFEYKSLRMIDGYLRMLIGVGTLRNDDDTGYSIEKFHALLKYNFVYEDLLESPYDYELYYDFPCLHDELQVWD